MRLPNYGLRFPRLKSIDLLWKTCELSEIPTKYAPKLYFTSLKVGYGKVETTLTSPLFSCIDMIEQKGLKPGKNAVFTVKMTDAPKINEKLKLF